MLLLPPRPPKGVPLAQQLAGGAASGLIDAGSQLAQRKQMEQAEKQENETLKRLGIDAEGLSPEIKKVFLAESLKGQRKGQEFEKVQELIKNAQGKTRSAGERLQDGELHEESQGEGELPSGLGTSELAALASYNKPAADILQKEQEIKLKQQQANKKENRRQFESDREFHSKTSEPILKQAESTLREAPIKRGLIRQQRRDIASGNTEGILPFLVDQFGIEAYRNPESARFKTASKERFVETLHSLGSAGAKANQFIEQQLVTAQPAIGRSAEANETVLDLEEFIEDMKTERAKIELDLAEKDYEEHGYARNDIGRRADKLMDKYAEKRQEEMAYDIRKRHESTLDDTQLVQEIMRGKVPTDTPLTLRAARILMIKNNDNEQKAQAEAKRLGFMIPSESTYSRE